MRLSAYRYMWLIAMFDLPVDTKKARREYTRFRKTLLKDGFGKMQYSVYIRHCASRENAEVHTERVRKALPPEGEVRLITLTDKQYERMEVFWGEKRKPPEPVPAQLELF
jgi:CRISPR-associated protein Cas2